MEAPFAAGGFLIDMDGLLLDTERLAERCWAHAEQETGFDMPDGFYFSLIGQSLPLIRDRLVEVMDPACDVDCFIKAANRIYHHALMEESVPVKAGAMELLAWLEENSVPRCLATSTFSELCRHKLESAGLARLIPLKVCGNEVRRSKPAPDIYLEAARRLGQSPKDLLVIEDSENGLLAGLGAGCRVIHVPDIGPVALHVQARVDRVYRDLHALLASLQRGDIRIA